MYYSRYPITWAWAWAWAWALVAGKKKGIDSKYLPTCSIYLGLFFLFFFSFVFYACMHIVIGSTVCMDRTSWSHKPSIEYIYLGILLLYPRISVRCCASWASGEVLCVCVVCDLCVRACVRACIAIPPPPPPPPSTVHHLHCPGMYCRYSGVYVPTILYIPSLGTHSPCLARPRHFHSASLHFRPAYSSKY